MAEIPRWELRNADLHLQVKIGRLKAREGYPWPKWSESDIEAIQLFRRYIFPPKEDRAA
jgi:hypothetical protein